MNVCTFIGRVGKDAVTRFTQGGKPVTGWSLAVDVGWGDKKTTLWIDCALFGERAEKLAPHILKGDKLGVSGEISTREHEGKTYIKLDVREVELLGAKREGDQSPRGGGPVQQRGERPVRGTARNDAPPVDDDPDIPFISNRGTY